VIACCFRTATQPEPPCFAALPISLRHQTRRAGDREATGLPFKILDTCEALKAALVDLGPRDGIQQLDELT